MKALRLAVLLLLFMAGCCQPVATRSSGSETVGPRQPRQEAAVDACGDPGAAIETVACLIACRDDAYAGWVACNQATRCSRALAIGAVEKNCMERCFSAMTGLRDASACVALVRSSRRVCVFGSAATCALSAPGGSLSLPCCEPVEALGIGAESLRGVDACAANGLCGGGY
jgi:hypothetical protein